MIYGPPGCGKTFLIIEMIIILCTAQPLADRFAVKRRLNVAYCAGEGISGLPSRFQAAATHHCVSEIPNFTFHKTMPQLYLGNDGSDRSCNITPHESGQTFSWSLIAREFVEPSKYRNSK